MRAYTSLAAATALACAHPVMVASPEAELAAINARCAALAVAPGRDSQLVTVGTVVNAIDGNHELAREYRQMIGQGIRQFLVVPTPLPLDMYDENVEANGYATNIPSRFTAMTLYGLYEVTLRRDGHLLHARPVIGGPPRVFDGALVAALAALDTSRLLPAAPQGADWFVGDTAALSIIVTAASVRRVPGRVYPEDLTWSEPLMRLRVPVQRIERVVQRISGPEPLYPENLARLAWTGKVVVQFVVEIDGTVNVSTMHVLAPVPRSEFVQAATDAIRLSRFAPMIVAGCPVRTLIEQPFVFILR